MARPLSLTVRFSLLFGVVATIGFLSFGWAVGHALEEHFDAEDAKELKVVARAVAASLAGLKSRADLEGIRQRFGDILVGHHGALLYVRDRDGAVLFASRGLDFAGIARYYAGDAEGEWRDNNKRYRVLVRHVTTAGEGYEGAFEVIAAVATDAHHHFISKFRRTLWLVVFAGIVIMGLMGWIAVHQGHRPLRRMVEQLSRVGANELNTRLDPDSVPAEITELAVSFNELLQRLEEAFARLGNFSADIAHELRTPVTNLMTQTQVAMSQARSIEEYKEVLYSNMEEYERMAQMIGDMLFLAKSDNALTPLADDPVDIAAEVRNLFDYYGAWAEERHVALAMEGAATMRGDKSMLRRALSNLLSNAIHHTPKESSVTVRIGREAKGIVIAVRNPGTPLAPEQLERVFDRFYRVDPSRQRSAEGVGLGLAIVKSIVEAHGGEVMACSDATGTEFRVSFPFPSGSVAHSG